MNPLVNGERLKVLISPYHIFFSFNAYYKIVLLQHFGCPDLLLVRQGGLSSTKVLITRRIWPTKQLQTCLPSFHSVEKAASAPSSNDGVQRSHLESPGPGTGCEGLTHHRDTGSIRNCLLPQAPLGSHQVPGDGSQKAKPLFSALKEEFFMLGRGCKAMETASSGAPLQQGIMPKYLPVPLTGGSVLRGPAEVL